MKLLRPQCSLQTASVAARPTHATKLDNSITFERRAFSIVRWAEPRVVSPNKSEALRLPILNKTCSQSVKCKGSIIGSNHHRLESQ